MHGFRRWLWLGCVFGAVACVRAERVMVFAAASLTDALKEIAADYHRQSDDKIVFNFAASSTLARQIEAGAPADLFFSADEAKMDILESRGLVMKETRRSLLGNGLVVVVAGQGGAPVEKLEDLAGSAVKRVALGNPKAVPAGIYAREYLQQQNLWDAVRKKVVPCEHVRAALAAVEAGNADAAIVYRTDAAISRKVRIAIVIPPEKGPTIRYPVALLKDARQPAAARRFLDYLTGKEAGTVFARHGFVVLHPAPGK